MKCIEITLAITDSGTADTLCGPQQTFLLFSFRYNGHLGRIFSGHNMKVNGFLIYTRWHILLFLFISGSTLKILCVIISVDKTNKQKNIDCSDLFQLCLHYFRGNLCHTRYSFLFACKNCLATSLPIISSSSLVKYRCSPYNF